MPSAQRSITINRPINEVFAYVADGENGPKWRSGKIEVKHESGEGVGAVYRQTVPGPVGRRVKADYEVTAFQSPKRMDFKAIAGPVRPTGSYVLSSPAEGKTKLTFSLDAKVGLVKRVLMMGRMVQKSMDGEMALARQAQEGARGGATGKRGWRGRRQAGCGGRQARIKVGAQAHLTASAEEIGRRGSPRPRKPPIGLVSTRLTWTAKPPQAFFPRDGSPGPYVISGCRPRLRA